MKTSVQKLKDSQVKLVVELDKEELDFYVREAEKRIANGLKIDGFREGRVPVDVARKKVGDEAIKSEALQLAVKQSAAEAIEEQKLEIIEHHELKINENSGTKLIYETMLTIFPEVNLGEYKGLDVKKNNIEVAPQEIDKTLGEVVKNRSQFEVSNEPARKGDRAEIDFEVKMDGNILDGGKSEGYPLVIGEDGFIPGFSEQIIGMKPEEEKEFSLNVPADYSEKKVAGKTVNCKIKVNKVEHIIKPELNDEFAKTLGAFSSLKDVKDSIREGLKMEKLEKEKERIRIALLEKILDKSSLEVPAVLVDRQLDSMVVSFDRELHQKGMELSLYLAHIKKTQDELKKDWRESAVKQVKLALITREIAKKEKLKVEEKEVGGELELAIQQFVQAGGNIGSEEEVGKLKNRIHDVLLNEKVFEFLEGNAKMA
ncbi:MAG: trigger factor [bacterium]|nr:trigger factor [bacterium]